MFADRDHLGHRPRARRRFYRAVAVLFVTIFVLIGTPSAHAYIGPGAGFAFMSSFLVLFATFALAFLMILTYPIRLLYRLMFSRNPYKSATFQKVVVLGLDGLDPKLTKKLMEEGKLPNFSKLAEQGCFTPLRTMSPAMSPVAWSSFQTGVNPGKHNIFDFLTRDPKSYFPILSSCVTGSGGKAELRLLRKSTPFWVLLGKKGVFGSILRVPITFPPEKFRGVSLSAMCVPDIRGTQGTFSFYSSQNGSGVTHTGGVQIPVTVSDNRIETYISGPPAPGTDGGELRIPVTIEVFPEQQEAQLTVGDEVIRLKQGVYSDWVALEFKVGLWSSVKGICMFMLRQVSPQFELYVTPINLDPESPAMPVSHPVAFSVYLSKMQGKYATLGLAEDTWALNERVIDEDAFLKQAYQYHQEREEMFFNALSKTRRGVCACVFDATDRIQHTFWRYLEPDHPANKDKEQERHKNAIEDLYVRMDGLVGRTMAKIDNKNTLFFVMSDHGFCSFRRGVNLNAWLHQNGYLALKEGLTESGDYFQGVDWSKTKAFTLGLTGIFLNIKGREAQGIVEPGEEAEALKKEIIGKLNGLKDEQTGDVAIREAFDSKIHLTGPYVVNAPDLIIGYNRGYRASWEAAVARVTPEVIMDNTKSWSGDHCIDWRQIPGVLFCNRKVDKTDPGIMDMAPTILQNFGVPVPAYMDGQPLFE